MLKEEIAGASFASTPLSLHSTTRPLVSLQTARTFGCSTVHFAAFRRMPAKTTQPLTHKRIGKTQTVSRSTGTMSVRLKHAGFEKGAPTVEMATFEPEILST